MKKITSIIIASSLAFTIMFSLTACQEKANQSISDSTNSSTAQQSTDPITTQKDKDNSLTQQQSTNPITTQKDKDNSGKVIYSEVTLDTIEEIVEKDVADTIAKAQADYDALCTEIDTYEKYVENIDKVEAFYESITESHYQLWVRMCEYSSNWAVLVMDTDEDKYDKYDNIEGIFDTIYDDGGDDIYDAFYDGILDDMYDLFYDGIIKDGYDTQDYKEWYDVSSDEYDLWYDTHSDIYDDWSDFRKDIYGFWSDLRSEIYGGDVERANEKIMDFQEEIEKFKNK